MRSGWESIQQNAEEFLLDVHAVSRNFVGEQGWKWASDAKAIDDQNKNVGRWERFTDEMMVGTQFYTNDSQWTDRVGLGLVAVPYTAIYAALRMALYDNFLNAYDYAVWRTGGDVSASERKKNARVLGAIGSIPLIAPMVALEGAGRVMGLTSYGSHIISAAGKRAANLSSRYTESCFGIYSSESIEEDEKVIASLPTNLSESADRLGLITLPGAIAVSEIAGAALLTGTLGIAESVLRASGFSERAGHEMAYATNFAGSMLTRWTGQTFTDKDFESHTHAMTLPVTSWWGGMDCVGMATGGLAVSALVIVGGAVTTCVLGVGETAGRAIGISDRASHEVAYAANLAGTWLTRWTGQHYSKEDFTVHSAEISKPVNSWWDGMDCLGMATGGLVISSLVVVGGGLAASTLGVGEGIIRAVGFSEYGSYIVTAAGKRAANILDRYSIFGTYSPEEIAEDEAKLSVLPTDGWGVADRVGLVTLPGAIALTEIVGATVLTATLGVSESLGRAVGISQRVNHEVSSALNLAGLFLSRWSGQEYVYERDFKPHITSMIQPVKTWWDGMDVVGMATGGLAVSGVAVVGGAVAAGTLGVGELVIRAAGCSPYGKQIVETAGKRAANISSRYTKDLFGTYSEESIAADELQLCFAPTDAWGVADRMGLVSLPGAVAAAEIVGAVALTGTLGMAESAVRAMGVSERVNHEVSYAANFAGLCLSRWSNQSYDEEKDFNVHWDGMSQSVNTWWDGVSCVGMGTGGLVASSALVVGGGLAAGILGAGELAVRSAGCSEYGGYIVKAAGKRAANMLGRYNVFGQYTADEIAEDEAKLSILPTDMWDVADRVGFVTVPGAIAISEIAGAAVLKVGLTSVEATGRLLGFSEYGAHIIKAIGMRAANISSRYTDCLFGSYADEEIEAEDIIVIADPVTVWDMLDRGAFFTFPAWIAITEYGGAIALTAVLGSLETAGRMAGFSNYGGHVIQAAGKRAANIMSRYTGDLFGTYSYASIHEHEKEIFSLPSDGDAWKFVDRVGLFTLPGAIAAVEIGSAVALTAGLMAGESVARIAGCSTRAHYARSYIMAKCGNAFGFADPVDLPDALQRVKAPVQSGWDVLDCIGTALNGVVTATIGLAFTAPLALLGVSKSNWHRFNYYSLSINNSLDERQGIVVDRTEENYHKAELARCEQTTVGKMLSHGNVFNIIGLGLFAAARYVVAPVIYCAVRAVKQLGGLVPLLKGIYNSAILPCLPQPDLNDPYNRVRKRFDNLKKSLDVYGHLNFSASKTSSLDIRLAVQNTENRNVLERIAFSIGSEARKVFSLGHTAEERVLAEFKDRFEEFANAAQREQRGRRETPVSIHGFFREDVKLRNGERFSYDDMINHIKGYYASVEDKQAIDRVAGLIRADIESSMKYSFPQEPDDSSDTSSVPLLSLAAN